MKRYTVYMYKHTYSYKFHMEVECKTMKEAEAYAELGKSEYALIKIYDSVTDKFVVVIEQENPKLTLS